MRVLSMQFSLQGTKEDTLNYVKQVMESNRDAGVDLVVLPEMFFCPYENSQFELYAEVQYDDSWQFLSALAKEYQVYLSAGTMPEIDAQGCIYNTAYVFDRNGNEIAKYRKMHLFDIDVKGGQYFKESDTLTPGEDVVVFDTEFGKMGICICYDFRFPELARLMVNHGAKIILCPAAFNTTTGPMHWELMFRQRAVDNQVFTIGTSSARDPKASYQSWGHSIIVDPWGRVEMQMDEHAANVITDLDLSKVEQVREQLPFLKHRRTDIYKKSEI